MGLGNRYYTTIKKYIQRNSNRFPSEELWFRKHDCSFWAFQKGPNVVTITTGIYLNGDINFNVISRSVEEGMTVDELVDCLTEQKNNEGYKCFAISL